MYFWPHYFMANRGGKAGSSDRSNQSILKDWIFIGRTDAEASALILWPPDEKNWLIRKDPDAGKYWRQEEKGMTEDKMVGWLHRLNCHELEQASGDGERQGSLACCSPWGRKELDMTEWLKNNQKKKLLERTVLSRASEGPASRVEQKSGLLFKGPACIS